MKISDFLLLLTALPATLAAPPNCVGINALQSRCRSNELPYRRDIFYVNGRLVKPPNTTAPNTLVYDQMYVEKLTPTEGVKRPKPLVFFHGGGTTGVVR